MTGKHFRDALRSGSSVYGTLVTSSSSRIFDTIVSLGADFVFLCTEHIFYNPDSLGWMCRAYKVAAGGHNGSRGSFQLQMEWAKAGANIIMHSSDVFLFADKWQDDISSIRDLKGEKVIESH